MGRGKRLAFQGSKDQTIQLSRTESTDDRAQIREHGTKNTERRAQNTDKQLLSSLSSLLCSLCSLLSYAYHMHVLVATAGALTPSAVVDFARHLIGGTGRVTVTTVVEVPRDFLESLDADNWHPLRETAAPRTPEEVVANYLSERGHRVTDPIRQALEAARIPCDAGVLEGGDPAAAISAAAGELDVDVIIVGATKQLFNTDAWESVSARLMIETGRPVLALPQPRVESDADDHASGFQPLSTPAEPK
jgi:nucleotide-binding universal stress UspA family protein